jgi:hypothetical protein
MPEIPFSSEVVREMKAKPYTMIVILALSAAVPYLWYADARADDVQKLSDSVTKVNATLVEAKLERINAQLFDIQAKIADKVAAHEPVDSIYTDKVKELEAQRAHTERELAALEK